MDLRTLKDALQAELRRPESMSLFENVKHDHPALAEHATPFSVLGTLDDRDPEGRPERDAISHALIVEYRMRPHPLWINLLLVAYIGMLFKLRGRIRGHRRDPVQRDQLVLDAFLDAVQAFPLDRPVARVGAYLRTVSCRNLYRRILAVEAEACRSSALGNGLPDLVIDHDSPRVDRLAARTAPSSDEVGQLEELLRTTVGSAIPESKLEVVIATLIRGERLEDYAARLQPDDSARAYERLKRERTRTIGQLKGMLGNLVQHDDPVWTFAPTCDGRTGRVCPPDEDDCSWNEWRAERAQGDRRCRRRK